MLDNFFILLDTSNKHIYARGMIRWDYGIKEDIFP